MCVYVYATTMMRGFNFLGSGIKFLDKPFIFFQTQTDNFENFVVNINDSFHHKLTMGSSTIRRAYYNCYFLGTALMYCPVLRVQNLF